MHRIVKAIIGWYLFVLSSIMLYTVISAIPDGTAIYVNRQWQGEAALDLICLSFGIVSGLAFMIYQFVRLLRKQ